MTKTLSTKHRPSEFLGVDPSIEDDDQLDLVLYELSWLKAVKQSIDARINEKIEAIKQEHEQQKVIAFGLAEGEDVTIQTRIEQLEELAKKYCKANKKKMITGKAKTKKFPHGSVSFNKQRDCISYKKGVDVKDSFELLDKLLTCPLVTMLITWMKTIFLFGQGKQARHLHEVIELQPRYNFTKLKSKYDDLRISDEHLDQLGLKFYEGTDKIMIKPAEYDPG
ncbi:host-nuclease inhibitor Gam family protein [Gimesia chilikensis]|uniref:host-nuclease inhibitor Gam family protein n=1 Tax=Gimesia chilikensis TaxID=2605989 RepID=UPI00118A2A14|nr:host-nuclease inhibitor Gam family protein [Gimesia chilikensis]QDT84591.1 Bacteriophage Mu Gam like protein [Gimesia chilikensis]